MNKQYARIGRQQQQQQSAPALASNAPSGRLQNSPFTALQMEYDDDNSFELQHDDFDDDDMPTSPSVRQQQQRRGRLMQQSTRWLTQQQPRTRRQCLMSAAAVVCLLVFILLMVAAFGGNQQPSALAPSSPNTPTVPTVGNQEQYYDHLKTLKTVQFSDVMQGHFQPSTRQFKWTPVNNSSYPDGTYLEQSQNAIIVKHAFETSYKQVILRAGTFAATMQMQTLTADGQYVLFADNLEPRWRHGSSGDYSIVNVNTRVTVPIAGDVEFALVSPQGHDLAYVSKQDLYLWLGDDLGSVRITKSAEENNLNYFNGIGDWVYQEEVLGGQQAMWWSPDGTKLMYLSFDDRQVAWYDLAMYGVNSGTAPYPRIDRISYPKPGTPNPIVTLWVVDVSALKSSNTVSDSNNRLIAVEPFLTDTPDNIIYSDVAWSQESEFTLVKTFNRYQDKERLHMIDWRSVESFSPKTTIVRDSQRPNGWFEKVSPIFVAPKTLNGSVVFIDVWPLNGYNQLGIFQLPCNGKDLCNTPIQFIGSGKHEVTSGVLGFTQETNRVHFLWSFFNSTTRTLFSANLNGGDPTPILTSNASTRGYYSASISPGGSFASLSYGGPEVPSTTVVSLVLSPEKSRLYDDNKIMRDALVDYSLPSVRLAKLAIQYSEDYNLDADYVNARVTYPVNFKPQDHYYPLFVTLYGGPNSQVVSEKWSLDFLTFLASSYHHGTTPPEIEVIMKDTSTKGKRQLLDERLYSHLRKRSLNSSSTLEAYSKLTSQPPFVVLQIDVRGTGFRGLAFRHAVTGQLGSAEVDDILQIVHNFVGDNSFIDPEKVAMWGWSYGGYLTAKCIERNSFGGKQVFTAAVSVAPVINWMFYDSVYTERYMKSTKENTGNYSSSAVVNTTNFANVRYLAIHGTGDDNVHVLNSLDLSHEIQAQSKVSPNAYRIHLVPDDAHSMQKTQNAYPMVHQMVVDWIVDAFKEVDHVRLDIAKLLN